MFAFLRALLTLAFWSAAAKAVSVWWRARKSKKELPEDKHLTAEDRDRLAKVITPDPRFASKAPAALPSHPEPEGPATLTDFKPESVLERPVMPGEFDLDLGQKLDAPAKPGEFDLSNLDGRTDGPIPEPVIEAEVVHSEDVAAAPETPRAPGIRPEDFDAPGPPEPAPKKASDKGPLPKPADILRAKAAAHAAAVSEAAAPPPPVTPIDLPLNSDEAAPPPPPKNRKRYALGLALLAAVLIFAYFTRSWWVGLPWGTIGLVLVTFAALGTIAWLVKRYAPIAIDALQAYREDRAARKEAARFEESVFGDPEPPKREFPREAYWIFGAILVAMGAAIAYNNGWFSGVARWFASLPWMTFAIITAIAVLIAGAILWIRRYPAQARAAGRSGWEWTRRKTRGTGKRWLAGILVALAVVMIDWGFWQLFGATGQTWFRFDALGYAVCWTVAGIAVFARTAFFNRKTPTMGQLFTNNDFWWIFGCLILFANAALAMANWGRPIALPREGFAPETRAWLENAWIGLLYGNDPAHPWKTAAQFAGQAPAWAAATWVWWKVLLVNFLLLVPFTFYAFSDEVKTAFVLAVGKRKERKGTVPPIPTTTAAEADRFDWKDYIAFEVLGEIIKVVVETAWKRGFRGSPIRS